MSKIGNFTLDAYLCQPHSNINQFFSKTLLSRWNRVGIFVKYVYNESPSLAPQQILDIYNRSLVGIVSCKGANIDVTKHAHNILKQMNQAKCLNIIGDSLLEIRRLRAKKRVNITDETRRNFQTAKTNDQMNRKFDIYADWDNEGDNSFQACSSGQQSEITGNKIEYEESHDHKYDDSDSTSDHEEVIEDATSVEEAKQVTNDKVKMVKENKKGQIRMSEKDREEIMKAYREMDEKYMWKLSSGRIVEKELYKLGQEQEFEHAIHSFILDVEDELIIEHFTQEELEEIDRTPIPEVPELSKEVDDVLHKFLDKKNLSEIRRMIRELMFSDDYNHEKHHDVDYICLALFSLVREIENGNIKDNNLENWFNCHVWDVIFDQAFGDIKAVSVVRGEYGTKYLREIGLKLPKSLKDMLVNLIGRINGNEELRRKIQTIGIVHEGLMMTIVYADNPKGYICRYRRCDPMEVPDTVEKFETVLPILAFVLNAKSVVQETVRMVQTGGHITKSFKSAGLRKRHRDEGQCQLPPCMSASKKVKYVLK